MLRQVNDTEKSAEYRAWQSAQEKQSQVADQVAQLKAQESELATQVRSLAADPGDLVHRAQSFLDGGIDAINHREHLAKELEKLREQIEIVERAAEIQDRNVDTAWRDYSAIVCREKFRVRYADAARRLIAGIEQIAEAFEIEKTVTNEIQAAGVVRVDIPTIRAPVINHFRDAIWVRSFIDGIKKEYPEI